jgi:hypothetical protein
VFTGALISGQRLMNLTFEAFGNAWPPRTPPSTQKFSEQEKTKLTEGFKVAVACSAMAVAAADDNFKKSEKLRKAFFARDVDVPRLKAGLKKMDAFLTDTNRAITFVDARGQSEKLLRFCEREVAGVPGRSTHGATKMELIKETLAPMTAGDYAYVKTLKGDPDGATEAHQGSGMRVYIGERGFHPSKTIRDTADTVYHELTHKVLATIDYAYTVPECKDIANTDEAIQCAASWSRFVTAFKYTWPDLDWDPRELTATGPSSKGLTLPGK